MVYYMQPKKPISIKKKPIGKKKTDALAVAMATANNNEGEKLKGGKKEQNNKVARLIILLKNCIP